MNKKDKPIGLYKNDGYSYYINKFSIKTHDDEFIIHYIKEIKKIYFSKNFIFRIIKNKESDNLFECQFCNNDSNKIEYIVFGYGKTLNGSLINCKLNIRKILRQYSKKIKET